MKLKIMKLRDNAVVPTRAHHDDAGIDLYANETVTIPQGEIGRIKTGIAIEIPEGYVGLCWDKSGLSTKYGIKVLAGVIDSGFRGELLLGVINLGKEAYTFEKGHKVMQMLIQKVELWEIEEVTELSSSLRGEGSFGSTGK
jgi:dUTP pyrophosphatase